jgi:hypothetical protein
MDRRLLDDPRFRRRALAASANVLAEREQDIAASWRLLREGCRELGVVPPSRRTPAALRQLADDIQAANAQEEIVL